VTCTSSSRRAPCGSKSGSQNPLSTRTQLPWTEAAPTRSLPTDRSCLSAFLGPDAFLPAEPSLTIEERHGNARKLVGVGLGSRAVRTHPQSGPRASSSVSHQRRRKTRASKSGRDRYCTPSGSTTRKMNAGTARDFTDPKRRRMGMRRAALRTRDIPRTRASVLKAVRAGATDGEASRGEGGDPRQSL